MKLWIYYETDGNSGWHWVKLFSSKEKAETYKKQKSDDYGHVDEIQTEEHVTPYNNSEVLCPECGSEMISRKGQYGNFWGCKSYPDCKGTRDSNGRSKAERAAWKEEQEANKLQDRSEIPEQPGYIWERKK